MGRGQLHHGAFDYVVVANRFLGFRLEVLQRGGEIIAASRGISGSGIFGGVILRSVAFRSVRGGSQWFRRRGLCVLGSVYYGRGAGAVCLSCAGVMVSRLDSRLRALLSSNRFIAFVCRRVRARLMRDVV